MSAQWRLLYLSLPLQWRRQERAAVVRALGGGGARRQHERPMATKRAAARCGSSYKHGAAAAARALGARRWLQARGRGGGASDRHGLGARPGNVET